MAANGATEAQSVVQCLSERWCHRTYAPGWGWSGHIGAGVTIHTHRSLPSGVVASDAYLLGTMTDPGNMGSDSDSALTQAVGDPFGQPIVDWYAVLIERFPLWAFQRRHFAALHDSALPTTYPLPRLIASILRDEGTPEPHS